MRFRPALAPGGSFPDSATASIIGPLEHDPNKTESYAHDADDQQHPEAMLGA